MSPVWRRPATLLAALPWLLFVTTPHARAHLGSTKYLRAALTPDGASIVADVDPIDLAYELGLDAPDDVPPEAILARADEVRAWAVRVITVRSDGGPCRGRAGQPRLVVLEGVLRSPVAVRIPLEHACPEPRTGVVLRDEGVFGSDPQHESIVRLGERPTILRAGRQEARLGDVPPVGATVLTFLLEGALHLATGADHLLFLLSLLLAAGELAAREGARRAARDVALVVTGFTLGHSVTLIASALDVVTLPARLVESAIAASIVVVAAWSFLRPEARRGLPWLAAGFGLVHGFGFSAVLRDLVLPTRERVPALLAFNAGIELAQLAAVALLIAPLAWAGGKPWYRRWVTQGGSLAIAAVGLGWLVERLTGG